MKHDAKKYKYVFVKILTEGFTARVNHTYGSNNVELYSMEFDVSARFACQDAPLDFSPYKSIAIIMTGPLSNRPKYVPATVHRFYLHFTSR